MKKECGFVKTLISQRLKLVALELTEEYSINLHKQWEILLPKEM